MSFADTCTCRKGAVTPGCRRHSILSVGVRRSRWQRLTARLRARAGRVRE